MKCLDLRYGGRQLLELFVSRGPNVAGVVVKVSAIVKGGGSAVV